MHSISINSLIFPSAVLLLFILSQHDSSSVINLGSVLNIRQERGVSFSMFLVIIVMYRAVHTWGPHGKGELSFLEILLVIIQHLTYRLVADFWALLIYLISDKGITVLYVISILVLQAPNILC